MAFSAVCAGNERKVLCAAIIQLAEGRIRQMREHLSDEEIYVVVSVAESRLRRAGTGVAGEGPDDLLDDVASTLKNPHWQPYLGRRSCPPEYPLLIRAHTQSPVEDLRDKVPLHGNKPLDRGIDFVTEGPDDGGTRTEMFDVPESFDSLHRRYRSRTVSLRHDREIPDTLWHTTISDFQQALYDYMQEPS